jgi:hypothetical protein
LYSDHEHSTNNNDNTMMGNSTVTNY